MYIATKSYGQKSECSRGSPSLVSMRSTDHMAQLLWTSALLVAATRLSGASAAREAPPGADPNAGSCPNCDNADNYLKPCNTSLAMSTWPGTFTYQPTALQAPCACATMRRLSDFRHCQVDHQTYQ
ncbi:hypothetical protein B0O80DRAFT_249660 [Mortierella sp. GBAus27b]|nr:hypothetical protein B0O80DRAFT_249660 [Mortierella sp. GBAus27b]